MKKSHIKLQLIALGFVLLLFSCNSSLPLSSHNVDNSSMAVEVKSEDTAITNLIKPYKEQLDQKMNQVIGFAPVELTEDKYQSTLGNFIIDLILTESEKYFGKQIDMAVVTNGGLRTPIPQGDITVGNIFELMPFNNEIVVLELNGEAILKMIQYGALGKNAVFAGVTYKIKNGQPEEILIKGKPFDYDAIYTLAVSDYLAGGGDRMSFLTESIKTHQLGILFRDAIIDHIQELTKEEKPILESLDNRVVIIE